MLLLLAKGRLGARVDVIHNRYPEWEKRFGQLPWLLPESALASSHRRYPA
jgi:hypothetical protein